MLTRQLGTGTDTVLALLDQRGRVAMEDDDGASRISRPAWMSGRSAALIRAATLENAGGFFMITLMRSAPLPPPDFATSAADAANRPPAGSGRDDPSEPAPPPGSLFRLARADRAGLVAATRYLRRSADTVLALLNASGAALAEDDDGGEGFASELPLYDAAKGAALLRVATLGDDAGELTSRWRGKPPPRRPTSPPPCRPLVTVAHWRRAPRCAWKCSAASGPFSRRHRTRTWSR